MKGLDFKKEEKLLEDENLPLMKRRQILLQMKKKQYDHLVKQLNGRKEYSLNQHLSWCRQKGITDSLDTIIRWRRHKGLIDPLFDEEECTEDVSMDEDSTDDDSDVQYVKTIQTTNRYMVVKRELGEPYFRLIPERPFDPDDDEKCGEEESEET